MQAEERGDLPPPELEPDDDDEIDPDEPTDEDIEAMLEAERERVAALKEGS